MALVIRSIKDKTLDCFVLLKKFHWSNEHFFQNEDLFWALGDHFLPFHFYPPAIFSYFKWKASQDEYV
jgi:hypothetical protein